ncbi:3-deoxy-manno-octulosonate cytidylyltransferase [Shewanella maritima]|uniref:3-deoxy-manno-octulosonate cytidylyltransferase n=1 Tax=Shewanella maritima TaxID=2520507 RepID=A0A411PEN7_9GAMM|nr:3-deoxy-manno-octulosonate cytidylyltransferase [Shewanella maritima]QBF81870.1 3-deoxy-manno-octulosonate cytidylyltransferase [Shewanella maritima]
MTNQDNFAVVIPARYKSSRFPGKPLVDLCGKPMIQHVWERCCEAVSPDKVFIATEDERIREAVEGFGGQVVMTSDKCLTGTDRLAEANLKLDCDFIVNVQGDEPLIDPANINVVIKRYLASGNITNAYSEITDDAEFTSLTVPKVVCSKTGRLVYMSRAAIPLTKSGEFIRAHKQVCIYAFSREHLAFFASHNEKSPLEEIEDIEILRFLEADYQVDMIEVPSGSLAVDVPEDVDKVVDVMARVER